MRWAPRAAAVATAAAFTVTLLPATATATPASAPRSPAAPTASAGTAALSPLAAKAATPPRKNSKNRTVIFVHGFDPFQKQDCYENWKPTIDFFKKHGWKKKNLITWGYYKNGTHCTAKYKGTTDSDIGHVSMALNTYIYKNFTSKGKTVDLVAHSMGGLVIRAALVDAHLGGKPIDVEDAVTLGSPHTGTKWGNRCNAQQCKDMRPGSEFLKGLNAYSTKAKRYHESPGGTNWTLVGSHHDGVVSVGSATAESIYAKHRIRYPHSAHIGHQDYYRTGTGTGWTYWRSNNYGKGYHKVTKSAGPIRMAYRGAYYYSRW